MNGMGTGRAGADGPGGEPGPRSELGRRLREMAALIAVVEGAAGQVDSRTAVDAIHALLGVHGDGLERILAIAGAAGEPGAAIVRELARDETVGGLLLLHGLHPAGVEARVRQALDGVRPYLASRGGDVVLLSARDGHVRLRLLGAGTGQSAVTLRYAVEQAILAAAPDVISIEVEHPPRDGPAAGRDAGGEGPPPLAAAGPDRA